VGCGSAAVATVPAVEPDDPVSRLLRDVVAGRPPAEDGAVTVLPQPPGPVAGVLAFCGHHVVAADVDPAWVRARLPDGDLSAPVNGRFLDALADRLGRTYDNLDMVLVAPHAPGAPPLDLHAVEPDAAHDRVDRSLRFRRDVRTWATADGAGLLVLARGLAGRWEAAFEVEPGGRGRGLGRQLAASAAHLVPEGEPVFVQVAPGNVASLRAVLATGTYVPIGAEVMFAPV
jgi:GNAT superfamily N-acetyltransferase